MEATVDRLAALLPEAAEALLARRDALREVRLRAGRPVMLAAGTEAIFIGPELASERLAHILAALMDYSVHAREDELRRGFFSLRDGCRVGVCGQIVGERGSILAMRAVGSLCVRIARPVPGCADGIMQRLLGPEGLRSALLVSPPGMGKTTMLRDIARQLSEAGHPVCVADERHEIAACSHGAPTVDLGPNADAMDGGEKALVIPMLIRSMAPRVVVADEIGGSGDAQALAEARRCGVAVEASAHGEDLESLKRRRGMAEILDGGIFDLIALLGGEPGRIAKVLERRPGGEEDEPWAYA